MKVRTCSALIVAMLLLIQVAGATIITDYRHANFYSYKTYSWGKVQPTIVVLRFTVQSQLIADSPTLSSQACTDPGALPDIFTVDPKLLDEISNKLQQRLSKKKMSVMVDPNPKTIPNGALVISGCYNHLTQMPPTPPAFIDLPAPGPMISANDRQDYLALPRRREGGRWWWCGGGLQGRGCLPYLGLSRVSAMVHRRLDGYTLLWRTCFSNRYR